MKFTAILLLLIIILLGCASSKKMNADQYLSWYESSENPLAIRDTTTNEFDVYLRELTPQFIAASCMKTNCLHKDTIKLILNESANTIEFQLKYFLPEKNMYNYNVKSAIHSSERKSYYSFDFKKDIKLITTNFDTIACSYLLFEVGLPDRPYGFFEFSFPYHNPKKIKEIQIKNRALSDEVTVFKMNNEIDLPKLKIK